MVHESLNFSILQLPDHLDGFLGSDRSQLLPEEPQTWVVRYMASVHVIVLLYEVDERLSSHKSLTEFLLVWLRGNIFVKVKNLLSCCFCSVLGR